MDRSIIAALVRSPALTARQLPAVIDAVAALEPQLLTEFADRPDLDSGLRARLVANAQAWQLTDLLHNLPSDRDCSNRLDRPELLAGFLADSDTIRTARVRRGWVRLVDDHRVLHPPRHVSSTSNSTTT